LPRGGTGKLYYLLKPEFEDAGIKLGRDGLFNYLRQKRLLIKPVGTYKRTTDSHRRMKKYPNLLQDTEAIRPEQAFVSAITYVESDEGAHYLSLITDAYNRFRPHLSLGMQTPEEVHKKARCRRQRAL
jgi:transposase InsO family protein